MHIEASRAKTLILGCDFPTFYAYRRTYSKRADLDICGFVYCYKAKPPIEKWDASGNFPLPVYSLLDLESAIRLYGIQKCIFSVAGIPMRKVQAIVHTVTSAACCAIEFVPPDQMKLVVNKPVICFSSLAADVGKTSLSRYLCDILYKGKMKVAVIIPLDDIDPTDKKFVIEEAYHYHFGSKDIVPTDLFPSDVTFQIQQYQKSGAFAIFITTNINRALISSEQLADVILFDSCGCSVPFVNYHTKFCVVDRECIHSPKRTSNWPGLVNAFDCTNIIMMSRVDSPTTEAEKKNLKQQLNMRNQNSPRSFFYLLSKINSGADNLLKGKPILALEHPDFMQIPIKEAAEKTGGDFFTAGLDDMPRAPVRVGPPRSMSPLSLEEREKSEQYHKKMIDIIEKSDREYVVLNFPFEIEGIDPQKHILHAIKEIIDPEYLLFHWVSTNFFSNRKPPLQKHFESQVDILLSMVSASQNELNVSNNDSANREAFTRLFLQSHIPPGYRVTTGEIFDCSSNCTGQLDVVIANDECPTMTIDTSGSVIAPILADSVLGVVEVKTALTVESLKKALSQLRPVKALMPSHETIERPDGQIIADPLGGKIITGVFAFSAMGDVEAKVGEIVNLYPHVADFIVLPDSFAFFSAETLSVCGIGVSEKELINGYAKYEPKGMGLALIFGVFNSLAAIRQFSASNFIRYLGGSWGGTQEAMARETYSLQSTLMKAHQLAIRDIDEEGKEEYLQTEHALLNIIGSVYSTMTENDTSPVKQ